MGGRDHVKAGLERDKAALLVVIGAMRDGTTEVLAIASGYREKPESWTTPFNPAIWAAARQVWPKAAEQRCWNHKMRNVLDRLPKQEQTEAKELLRTVGYAPTRAAALKAREAFKKRYDPWYPKAVATLEQDWERMVTFYDFPEEHWKHLRTTNVVENPFASARRPQSASLLMDVFDRRKFEDGKPVGTQQRKVAG